MAKKLGMEAVERGRPRAIYLTPEQLDILAAAMKDAATYTADTAKFMRENSLPKLCLPVAKVIDEHLPAVQAFARRAFAEVGPASTAHTLGRKTRLELNQEKHDRAKRKKADS